MPDDALPAGFYGNVTYEGSFHFQTSSSPRTKQGSFTLHLQINGQDVRGRYTASYPMSSGTVTGTRLADSCRLTDNNTVWVVHCGRNQFVGQALSDERVRRPFQYAFDGRATKLTDIAEAKRVQAAQAQAQAAALAALPTAGPVLSKRVEEIVAKDARGWHMNSYDRGSVRNVRVADGSVDSGTMTLRADYTFNGGSPGWVLVKMTANKFDCVRFWDGGGCRGMRSEEQAKEVRKAVAKALEEGASGSSSSSGGNATITQTCYGGKRWSSLLDACVFMP